MSGKSADDSHPSDNPQENRTQSTTVSTGRFSTRKKTIFIPSKMVGLLIGTKGERINSLQCRSGAIINVHKDSEPGVDTREVDLIGTEDEIRAAEALVNSVVEEFSAQGGLCRVSNDNGKRKVAEQDHSHDIMSNKSKRTRLDISNRISFPNAVEQIDSARQISTGAQYQPYGQYQFPTGYWASNPQAGWYQPRPTHTPAPPQQGFSVNPAYQNLYGAQPVYGWPLGYGGSGGYYPSFAPSSHGHAVRSTNGSAQGGHHIESAQSLSNNPYTSYNQPYSWLQARPQTEALASEQPNPAGTTSQVHDFSQMYMIPYASYNLSNSWLQAPPQTEAHASEPSHAGTGSQGHGALQVYMNPSAPTYQLYSWPKAPPQTEAHALEPSQAGNGSQGHVALQEYMNPSAPNYQLYLWPQAQPRPEAHISESNQAGTASQGQGSSQVYTNPHATYSQSYTWPNAQTQQEAQISEPNHAGTASQAHGATQVYTNPYPSYNSQSYTLPYAQPRPEAQTSEPNRNGTASQGHGSLEVSQTTSHPSSEAL